MARWGLGLELGLGLGLALLGLGPASAWAADFDLAPQGPTASDTPVPGVLTQGQVDVAEPDAGPDAGSDAGPDLSGGAQEAGTAAAQVPRAEGLSEGDRSAFQPDLWTDDVPVWLQAGDVPTAYNLARLGYRVDARVYTGGGLLGQFYAAPFSRLLLGLSGDVPEAVGSGPVFLDSDDLQGLARVLLLEEQGAIPALAVGWDGSSYADVAPKGIYAVFSKELHADPVFAQVHLGADSGDQVRSFYGRGDLRGFAAATASWRCLGAFSSLDEVADPRGPRWCAGVEGSVGPATLALEFQDLGALRTGVPASRLLRVSWGGSF